LSWSLYSSSRYKKGHLEFLCSQIETNIKSQLRPTTNHKFPNPNWPYARGNSRRCSHSSSAAKTHAAPHGAASANREDDEGESSIRRCVTPLLRHGDRHRVGRKKERHKPRGTTGGRTYDSMWEKLGQCA
jgi:hypothetical protein